MAALVALLMKSRRTALDMAVYQRRISSVKRMFEPENSLMNFNVQVNFLSAFSFLFCDCFQGHDYFTVYAILK